MIEQDVQSVRVFLKQQQERRRKVVLVTVRIFITPSDCSKRTDFCLVHLRVEEQLFPWNSMCEQIDFLSSVAITLVYIRMACPSLGLLRAQRPVPG